MIPDRNYLCTLNSSGGNSCNSTETSEVLPCDIRTDLAVVPKEKGKGHFKTTS